jgi:predicted nuclease with TOPRIM domain
MQPAGGGLEALQAEKTALEEENEDLQERIADLEIEAQEARSAFDSAAGQVKTLAETFNVDVDLATVDSAAGGDPNAPDDVEDLRTELATARKTIQSLEAENERLREEVGRVVVPTDYQDFVTEGLIQTAIEETTVSSRHMKDVVASIVQVGSGRL